MRRRRTTGVLAVLGALLVVALGASAAAAQGPERIVIPVDDQFVDEDLSEECGVEVTATVTGQVIEFTFADGKVLQSLGAVNIQVVWTAGDNQIRARNVGADVVRAAPDGTAILTTTGQLPYVHRRAEDQPRHPARSSWSHITSLTSRTCARS